jgi:hypothetical protein
MIENHPALFLSLKIPTLWIHKIYSILKESEKEEIEQRRYTENRYK